jgi:hypothetical protein
VEAGLAEETSKRFDKQIEFTSWGALIEGGRGYAGAPPGVRAQLLRVTSSIILSRPNLLPNSY